MKRSITHARWIAGAADLRWSWQVVWLSVPAILLFAQPLLCVAHCIHVQGSHHQPHAGTTMRTAHAMPGHGAHHQATPGVASCHGMDEGGTVPAYWPALASVAFLTATVLLSAIRLVMPAVLRPTSWTLAPVPPPPR